MQDCGSADYYTTLGFDSWQEYTGLGFPIATNNHDEQIRSIHGHYNFLVDESGARKLFSRLCQYGKFQNGMEKLVAPNTGFIVFLTGPFFSQCSCCYRRGIQFSLSLCFSRNILMQNPLWPEKL